jgi:hypothetical protein
MLPLSKNILAKPAIGFSKTLSVAGRLPCGQKKDDVPGRQGF